MPTSLLTSYCLKGLHSCWQTERGLFSHSFTDGSNISQNVGDSYYSLNVLLGLSKLPEATIRKQGFFVEDIFNKATKGLLSLPHVPTYAFGMAMWVAARYGFELSSHLRARVWDALQPSERWTHFTGQDVGLLLSGCAAMKQAGSQDYNNPAKTLVTHINQQLSYDATGLFFNAGHGFRRRFSSYATGVYLNMGLFDYGAAFNDNAAIERALVCVSALDRHQGSQGEWPWFYDVPRHAVADYYQVYSVHQDGMAPAYLHLADKYGFERARESIIKGFRWILGENERGESMLVPKHGVIKRSIVRRNPLTTSPKAERLLRATRAVRNMALKRSSSRLPNILTRINPECRSYHLGWVLWSFGDRTDYPELTENSVFQDALH